MHIEEDQENEIGTDDNLMDEDIMGKIKELKSLSGSQLQQRI